MRRSYDGLRDATSPAQGIPRGADEKAGRPRPGPGYGSTKLFRWRDCDECRSLRSAWTSI